MKVAAQLVKNGERQAILLPRQFHFPGKTVMLRRTKAGLVVSGQPEAGRSLGEAARKYQAFLRDHPEERASLAEWESARLGD